MLVRSLLFACFLFLLGNFGVIAQQKHDYTGAKKCKVCHNKPNTGAQYAQWEKTPHAKAFERLKGAERTNPKCTKCHATAAVAKAGSLGGLTMEEGVSCETCHGPGADYSPIAIMKSREKSIANGLIIPDEKLCKTCHNAESPHYKGFDYKAYLAKVAHPNPAAPKK